LLGELQYFEDFIFVRETRSYGKVSPERRLDGLFLWEEKRCQIKYWARTLLLGIAMQDEEIEDVSI
jgi:hypothetical protein